MRLIRSSFLSLIIVSALCFTTSAIAAPQKVALDTNASQLTWVGKKVTGQHNGTLQVKSGEAVFENGILAGGKFEIDMSSITVSDLTNPTDNKKLTNHLKSDDFFGSSLFPVATFTITKAEKIDSAKEGEPNYNITGNLSVKGISNEVTFPATVSLNGDSATAKATAEIDRTKFNVRYGSGKFFENLGNKLIYDTFTVGLDLSAKAQG